MSDPICSMPGCGKSRKARGWCAAHYGRWRRGLDPHQLLRKEIRDGKRMCSRCHSAVPVENFTNASSSWCRPCAAAAKKARYVSIIVTLPAVFCSECGTRYSPRKRTEICCSTLCAGQRRLRFNRAATMQRRAMMMASFVESVDPQTVFERDAWICQICHEVIPAEAKWPATQSASVDHIVPLIAGGDHSYRNVQASHLGCNTGKQDRIDP